MPDVLTEHERAAIAAYRGKVQRIPRGVSSEQVYVYDESAKKNSSGGLTIPGAHWKAERTRLWNVHMRGKRFQALKRRESGKPPVVAEPKPVLVMVTPAVEKPKPAPKVKAARKPRPKPTKMQAQRAAIAKREAKVRDMILARMTRPAIAAHLGISVPTVHGHIVALRERGELPPSLRDETTNLPAHLHRIFVALEGGGIVSPGVLMTVVYGGAIDARVLRMSVSNLAKRLAPKGYAVENVWGVGYRLVRA
jgi:biotin operon repressor